MPVSILNLKGIWRWLIVPVSASFFMFGAIAILFTLLDIRDLVDGRGNSFEKISELKVDNNDYRLYRSNGGATTAYSLSLTKETSLIAGIKLVEYIRVTEKNKGFNAAYNGRLEKISPNKIRLIFLGTGVAIEQIYEFFVQ